MMIHSINLDSYNKRSWFSELDDLFKTPVRNFDIKL